MYLFELAHTWKQAYPGASAGVLALADVNNPAHDEAFHQQKLQVEADLRARFAGQDRAAIAALPIIQAYKAYYKRFEKSYHVQLQLESVALKGKSIPSVACLVEAMFVAELKNLLLTAGHDLDTLTLPVTLGVADGSETFTQLRGDQQTLKAGDMFMADRSGVISTVIYGPDQRTQITPATRRVLYTVYAPPGIDPTLVRQHLTDIRAYVLLFAPQAKTEMLEVFPA
jgi:DNA/RNA-binding domain of Phe-tRNA-synthetase-like protein